MPQDLETPGRGGKPVARAVVHGRASLTAVGWSLWILTFALTVLVTVVDRTTFLAGAALVALGAVSVLLLVRRAARRVQWVLLLDNDRLSIERVPPLAAAAIRSLDVSAGVQLDVAVDKRTLRIDAAIALQTTGRRALWSPGIRPAQAIAQLVTFLRTNEVTVTLPHDAPIGWFPPNYPLN